MTILRAILALLISVPIWFYLLYQILVRVDASELMWFLFWCYLPVTILASLLTALIKEEK